MDNEEILWSYYSDVVAYLRVFGLPKDMLEDVVQQTFVEALRGFQGLRDKTKVKHWLIIIAKRTCNKRLAELRLERQVQCSFEEYVDSMKYNAGVVTNSLFQSMIAKSREEDLHECLNRLSSREQKVIMLHYAYGHTLKEIAELMGQTLESIKSVDFRAKKKLRKMLEEEDDNEKQKAKRADAGKTKKIILR